MGFLPQFYIIKDAFISDVGLLASPTGNAVPLRETIKAVNNQSIDILYSSFAKSNTAIYDMAMLPVSLFSSSLVPTAESINDNIPFKIYLSEDSNEDKLIADSLEHLVPKSLTNCKKSFENGKVFCIITYTNSGAEFDITTVRIARRLNISSSAFAYFMIYSEPIGPITIGTGETVQIRLEV